MTGVELIAAERQRQVEKEGFDRRHDDTHDREELAEAAECYVRAARATQYSRTNVTFDGYRPGEFPPRAWPWERESWKPSDDPIRNLVKAGALIAAEIDRLQRVAQPVLEQGKTS